MWINYLIISIIILFILSYLLIYTRRFLKEIYDSNFLTFYDFFCYFLVMNISILLFMISYYYHKSNIPGQKGPKGDRGDDGNQGKDSQCGVCEKRDNKFQKVDSLKDIDTLMDTSTIDNFIKNNRIKDIIYKNSIKGLSNRWNAHSNINNDSKTLGDNSMKCDGNIYRSGISTIKESCNITKPIQSNTYINGAALRIDSRNNDLYSIQYKHNKEEKNGKRYTSKTELLGGPKNRWGGENVIYKYKSKKQDKEHIVNGSNRGKYYDFECPKGSGIYRIDTLNSSPGLTGGGIKGIKFYCKDVKTGKNVKFDNINGRNMDSIYFGMNPNIKNKNLIYKRSVCKPIKKDNKMKPSFISSVGAIQGHKINALNFYNCSYRK